MKNVLSGVLSLVVVLAAFAARAQQDEMAAGPATKTTFVRLANNANAIIVEPIAPDPQRSRVAILVTHPDHLNTFNYFIGRELSRRGYRVMMMNYYGPEQVYDEFLAPLAAAVKQLRRIPGVQKVVLAGHSTGGDELTFYQDVAENGLPPADGIMMLDSNAGAIERLIATDPSIDSRRPRDHQPELDMFNPRNGYNPATKSGTYSAAFERKYLQAQSARQTHLIEEALARLAKIEQGEGDYKGRAST
jgi:hypothetical protein